jgi:hypothetical protein
MVASHQGTCDSTEPWSAIVQSGPITELVHAQPNMPARAYPAPEDRRHRGLRRGLPGNLSDQGGNHCRRESEGSGDCLGRATLPAQLTDPFQKLGICHGTFVPFAYRSMVDARGRRRSA